MAEGTLVWESDLIDDDAAKARSNKPIAHFSNPCFEGPTGGVYESNLTYLIAGPGVGKTTYMHAMADDLASQNIPVIFFEFEMRRHRLLEKSISRYSNETIPVSAITQVDDDAYNSAVRFYRENIAANIAIIDEPKCPLEIRDLISECEKQRGVKPVIFIDYVQVMPSNPGVSFTDERLEVKASAQCLRAIANSTGCPIFAISSITRTSYNKQSVNLDSLSSSSELEYGADSVVFITVAGKGAERENNMFAANRPTVLSVIKGRYQGITSSEILFDTQFATFRMVK